MITQKAIIDLIIPVYNESDRMTRHVEEMLQTVWKTGYQPHVILVDDGSRDNSWSVIQALSQSYEQVEGVRLSRNFGKDNALFAGLHYTCGEATITIDSDGQHPIALIPNLIKAWQDGAMVVHAVKKERHGERLGMRIRATAFNYLMSKLMDSNQTGASDYKLLDRKMLEILRQHETSNAIYRFSVANLGFPSANISMNTLPTDRPSRWQFASLLQLAIRAVMFHTDIPLKALVTLMVLTVVLSLALMSSLLVAFFYGTVPSGYSTLLTLNLLILCITVIGFTGLAVYLKGTVDIVAGRSGAIVWQHTPPKGVQQP
jgi:glycosyltransferase involved in cell wall biosynthesis